MEYSAHFFFFSSFFFFFFLTFVEKSRSTDVNSANVFSLVPLLPMPACGRQVDKIGT